jgi:hypothetical protein
MTIRKRRMAARRRAASSVDWCIVIIPAQKIDLSEIYKRYR